MEQLGAKRQTCSPEHTEKGQEKPALGPVRVPTASPLARWEDLVESGKNGEREDSIPVWGGSFSFRSEKKKQPLLCKPLNELFPLMPHAMQSRAAGVRVLRTVRLSSAGTISDAMRVFN